MVGGRDRDPDGQCFGEGGRRIDELVSLFDVGPTLLELAGCEVPDHFAAESLLPAISPIDATSVRTSSSATTS